MNNEELKPNPQRKLFFGLFVFPLLIAIGMALLLCTVVILTNEEETPESLIAAIKTGSPSKRWQKAFELSNELNRNQESIRSQGMMKEVIHILGDNDHYDARTRAYMAIALSHFRDPSCVSALRNVLKEENEDIQLYALWSLGILSAKSTIPDILPFLHVENDRLRKMAVYVLGVLGEPITIISLRPLLDDPAVDVRWNTALSLARLGDASGWDTLVKMLERKILVSQHSMSEEQIEKVMINAAKGLALLGKPESLQILEPISRNDQSLKVRQSAIEAMQYLSGQRKELPIGTDWR